MGSGVLIRHSTALDKYKKLNIILLFCFLVLVSGPGGEPLVEVGRENMRLLSNLEKNISDGKLCIFKIKLLVLDFLVSYSYFF